VRGQSWGSRQRGEDAEEAAEDGKHLRMHEEILLHIVAGPWACPDKKEARSIVCMWFRCPTGLAT